MMLITDEIAVRYKLSRTYVSIRMAGVDDFGGRYDNVTVRRIMESPEVESEEDIDEVHQWLGDEVGF